MEGRLLRLEGRIDKVADDMSRVREDLVSLKERVLHLLSKRYIDAHLLGLLVLIGSLVTFGEKLQALIR